MNNTFSLTEAVHLELRLAKDEIRRHADIFGVAKKFFAVHTFRRELHIRQFPTFDMIIPLLDTVLADSTEISLTIMSAAMVECAGCAWRFLYLESSSSRVTRIFTFPELSRSVSSLSRRPGNGLLVRGSVSRWRRVVNGKGHRNPNFASAEKRTKWPCRSRK